MSYKPLFVDAGNLLRTHEAYDIGALAAAQTLAAHFGAPLFAGEVTRLLIDLNRSLHHPRLHSIWTAPLGADALDALRMRYYLRFRDEVAEWLAATLSRRPVLHVSVHSFTPEWLGAERHCDVGVLYDPRRAAERAFADRIVINARVALPQLRLRRNYPYRGVADGHVTALRRVLPNARYAGVELELSQALTRSSAAARRLARSLADVLEQSLAD